MSSDGSVTGWIEQIKDGDSAAFQALWERYFPILVSLARRRLEGIPRQMSDEEDMAVSVLKSFCLAAERGRFPDLTDRNCLWRLLFRMTDCKAIDQYRYEKRRPSESEEIFGQQGLDQNPGDFPSPEEEAIFTEEIDRLIGLLKDPRLEMIALAKMAGCTNREIAKQIDCTERTVERELQLIRSKWKQEFST